MYVYRSSALLYSTLRISVLSLSLVLAANASITVATSATITPREQFGVDHLKSVIASLPPGKDSIMILVGTSNSSVLARVSNIPPFSAGVHEAFHLLRAGQKLFVVGSDPSGVLYGCLELAKRIQSAHGLPAKLDFSDHPTFLLRGPCIGMQRSEITYEGSEYDYRYTPQEFPFFYDKELWIRYLDFLMENRMNVLYLWNGHPFTSLLKLLKYPEAQELSNDQLDQNIRLFQWLTREADKRGIWVIQEFYNIHLSHAFARAHNLPYHLSAPNPLASAYTRYCISEFIKHYPNVGLMMTLGEALKPQYGAEWLSQTIIPGIKDGMRALGLTQEPPIIVRAHATDIEADMRAALPIYKNIYTMQKWTGESLTWTNVRGKVLEMDEKLVRLGSTHIVNIHLLSNLEPFRWGDPEYIRQVMQSCQRIGIKGLHLYPLRYWEWPVSADHPPELQIDRDWIWFAAWARYAWNPNRNPRAERAYWMDRIADKYGTRAAASRILDAYQESGICAPRLLPRIGITEGNRQSFTLGMLMTQLIDPQRYHPEPTLWTADAPPGERLSDYVQREWLHQPHEGETPIGVADEVVKSARRAVTSAEAAEPFVTKNKEEFKRFLNDMRCILAEMQYYQAKTRAAALVMRYGYSKDIKDLKQAVPLLEQSLADYKRLVALTSDTYRQACSVHTAARRIPFKGGPNRYTHWRDCLPEYEAELSNFKKHLHEIETAHLTAAASIANLDWLFE
jgi:hypothetical protein